MRYTLVNGSVPFIIAKDWETKHLSVRDKIMLHPYNNHFAAIKMNEAVLCVQIQNDH